MTVIASFSASTESAYASAKESAPPETATITLSPASYFSSQVRTALRTAGTAVVIGQE